MCKESLKKLQKFVKENPLETGGSITKPKVTIEYYDDGDTGYYIKIPYCSYNIVWQKSVFKFLDNFEEEFGLHHISTNSKQFKIDFNLTICDPD